MKAVAARLISASLALCCMLFAGCDSGYDCALENVAYNRIKFYTIGSDGTTFFPAASRKNSALSALSKPSIFGKTTVIIS